MDYNRQKKKKMLKQGVCVGGIEYTFAISNEFTLKRNVFHNKVIDSKFDQLIFLYFDNRKANKKNAHLGPMLEYFNHRLQMKPHLKVLGTPTKLGQVRQPYMPPPRKRKRG